MGPCRTITTASVYILLSDLRYVHPPLSVTPFVVHAVRRRGACWARFGVDERAMPARSCVAWPCLLHPLPPTHLRTTLCVVFSLLKIRSWGLLGPAAHASDVPLLSG